jgi:hypothetical protein
MALYEVAIDSTMGGLNRTITNVFHVEAPDGTFPSHVAETCGERWQWAFKAHTVNTMTFQRARVRTLNGVMFAEYLINTAGTFAGTGLPPNTAVLLRKQVPGLPRRRYGRLFMCGIPESAVDHAGNVASASITAWTGAANSYLSGIKALNCTMVQPYWTTNMQGQEYTSVMEVTAMQCMSRAATQRRRMRNR